MAEPRLNRFAVIGNPVAHSMSPYIHKKFAAQFGIELSYEKISADKNTFRATVEQFFADGGLGLNVTTPFKSLAAEMVDRCSDTARSAASVNTIYPEKASGLLAGETTDGVGWLRDIRRLNINLDGSKLLVIGAGGAARIIINQLLTEPVRSIHVCNRTEHRARQLSNAITTASGLTNIPEGHWDLIINTLPVGWQGGYPAVNADIDTSTRAYDLNYGAGALPFKGWFTAAGGSSDNFHDGWGMLVEQAAESFYLWWKLRPVTGEIIEDGIPRTGD